jgi:DNA modification methylase
MEINKIYNENCIETMAKIPACFIDLVVTSPPYDDLRKYKGYSFEFEVISKELFRVIKDGGVLIWIVGDQTKNGSESGTSFKQALYFKEIGFNLHDTMIYKKQNYTPLTHNRYEQEFEYMFCLSKGRPKTFNPIKIPCKYAGQETWGQPNMYKDTSGELTRVNKTVINDTKIHGNIFEYLTGSTQTGKIKHPAMFPEKLAEDQILTWSNENELIYDCFLGSGTSAKIAKLNNRNYIGSEVSPEYFKIAETRIKEALKQTVLFDEVLI